LPSTVVVTGAAEVDSTEVVAASTEAAEAPYLTEAVAWRRVLPVAGHMDDPVDMVGTVRAVFRDTAAGRAVWAEHEREQLLQRARASAVPQRIAAE
jgi:hypothetical protein